MWRDAFPWLDSNINTSSNQETCIVIGAYLESTAGPDEEAAF
ncbi:hypothetical protein KUC_3614 [Vreelandella boliviensis LC1]|uniref:Uncharacterized protein n=1 Tax=Vreelandella boliviensis LC1 TaxID=1072583 RepID=A0A7U9BXT1_9GAMM|nr:hypothetical protein KUC_3614 [Halomonas boliviensis LC1]